MLYNEKEVDLSVALWLATDTYDHDDTVISATGLIKPLKKIILAGRVPDAERMGDVINNVASSIGTAVHDSIESAWVNNYKESLANMGYSKAVIDSVLVNPTVEERKANPDKAYVFTERRTKKVIDGVTISGEYDFCAEGRVEDFKTTGTYTYEKNTKENEYRLQGSIYRWLDPEIITQDVMTIQYIFTDWKRNPIMAGPNYPKAAVESQTIELLSYEETEAWIKNKLADIEKYKDLPESEIPRCTQEDLWQDDAKYKYYADPLKVGGRSTKNFNSGVEAEQWKNDKGKGIVVEELGKVRACAYCDGFSACKQKDEYMTLGILV